jgi:twinkle protein
VTRASPSPSNQTPWSPIAGTANGHRPHHAPTGTLSSRTAALLERRGLDIELCSQLGLETASAPDGGEDWLALPYVKGGHTIGHKYRRIIKSEGPNFSADKGVSFPWWNHDVLTDASLTGPVVVTEGEFDALAVIQCGIGRVVSVPNGAPEREVQGSGGYSYLADTLPLFAEAREIVLAVDRDGPGVALMNDLAKRFGRGRCKLAAYPEGCKDLNEVLVRHGPAAVVQAIDKAKWLAVAGLYLMAELPPIAEPEPHVTGISGLGEHFRIRVGDFSVLTGVPGTGKSTLVNDIACRMAERYGWRTCFASPEQNPQTDHRRALRAWINRKPEAQQSAGELQVADQWINDHFSFVVGQDDAEFDLEWMLDKLASAVVRFDAKFCVVDPWNELDHAKPKDATTTEYVGWAIRQLKKFAKKWQVHLMVVAHPAKMLRNRDGDIPRPTLYDISDSAHWFNKPDAGLIMHPSRDDEGGVYMSVLVAKSRYHDKIGRPGEARLIFNPHTARFEAA